MSVRLKNEQGTKTLLLHRLVALAWISNPDALPDIDHINNNKEDNRVRNLQWVSTRNNCRKQHVVRGNVPYKGVCQHRGRYHSRITYEGRVLFLGSFNTAFDAANAYDSAARKLFNEYAITNVEIMNASK